MMSMRTRSASSADVEIDAGAQLGVPGLEVRDVQQLVTRAGADESGTFEGWGCRWDVQDSYGTIFRQGCFASGGLDGEPYALLDMHSPFAVLGVFRAEERDEGLWLAGGWDDTTAGRDARVRARTGSSNGLSVGFVPMMVDPDDENVFTQCRLVEVSQITRRMAAVPGAELVAARKALQVAGPRHGDAAARAIARLRLASLR